MDKQLIKTYLREYGEKYHQPNIFEHYPEAKTFPAYVTDHFDQEKIVLDLGFGSGLWFWASFLPALERLDGLDLYPEALEEANRIFEGDQVPAGYRAAHAHLGTHFTRGDLERLKEKQGYFAFQDYREPWPERITQTQYDLVTENGGGLGQMASEAEVVRVLKKVNRVIRPGGYFLFINFKTKPSALEQALGHVAPGAWYLNPERFTEALKQANLELVDLHLVNHPADSESRGSFFYGHARKPEVAVHLNGSEKIQLLEKIKSDSASKL